MLIRLELGLCNQCARKYSLIHANPQFPVHIYPQSRMRMSENPDTAICSAGAHGAAGDACLLRKETAAMLEQTHVGRAAGWERAPAGLEDG